MISAEGIVVSAKGNVVSAEGNVVSAKGNVVPAKGNVVSAEGNVVSTKGNVVSAAANMLSAEENFFQGYAVAMILNFSIIHFQNAVPKNGSEIFKIELQKMSVPKFQNRIFANKKMKKI